MSAIYSLNLISQGENNRLVYILSRLGRCGSGGRGFGYLPISSFHNTVLYSTLMPCYLCAGAVVQFGIKKVIAGESKTFPGSEGVDGRSWSRGN